MKKIKKIWGNLKGFFRRKPPKNEFKTREDYYRTVFGVESPKNKFGSITDNRFEYALKHAHHVREFEINLYWQRALFFWGFLVTLFGGFGYLMAVKNPSILNGLIILGISLLGLFVNCAWYYVAKGAKSWQENWEQHIDFLEAEFTGDLHKTAIGKKGKSFSISNINQTVIGAFGVSWFFASIFGVANLILLIKAKMSDLEKEVLEQHIIKKLFSLMPDNLVLFIKGDFSWALVILPPIIIVIIACFFKLCCWRTSNRTLGKEKFKSPYYWQREIPDERIRHEEKR